MDKPLIVERLTRAEDVISAALDLTRAIDYGTAHPTDQCSALNELTYRVRHFYKGTYGPMPAPWLRPDGVIDEELEALARS